MLKMIGFGIAVGAAIQATRKLPPDGPLTSWGAVVLILLALGCGWAAGRARRGAGAVAVASASADATAVASADQRVQVVNVISPEMLAGGGAGADVRVPAQVDWLGPERRLLSADELDGADLRDLSLDVERDTATDTA